MFNESDTGLAISNAIEEEEFEATYAVTFWIVVLSLSPLLCLLICLSQFHLRKCSARTTTTLYETDNTDAVLTSCGWLCVMIGAACMLSFTSAVSDWTNENGRIQAEEALAEIFQYSGPMRWKDITIQYDSFMSTCSENPTQARTRCRGDCCTYHTFTPSLQLEYSFQWACPDHASTTEDTSESMCSSQAPLEDCRTIVCDGTRCSQQEKEEAYHSAVQCVHEHAKYTGIWIQDASFSRDPATMPNVQEEPTWLAYGSCDACQTRLDLKPSSLSSSQETPDTKVETTGRVFCFAGLVTVGLGCYVTVIYSLYLVNRRNRNSISPVVPVAKKCQRISLDNDMSESPPDMPAATVSQQQQVERHLPFVKP